jgi:hypothetical protein
MSFFHHHEINQFMRRTATAAHGPSRSATAIQVGVWKVPRSCEGHTTIMILFSLARFTLSDVSG